MIKLPLSPTELFLAGWVLAFFIMLVATTTKLRNLKRKIQSKEEDFR